MTRPCDVNSNHEALTLLNEQGLAFNEVSITVKPPNVILDNGPGRLVFNMDVFRRLAVWYVSKQKKEND